MISQFSFRDTDKTYLDQLPHLERVVREFLETLDLDGPWGVAFDEPKVEVIECRRRDGFIPHAHNCGGFDLEYLTDVGACVGSGCGPNLADIEHAAECAYDYALEAFREQNTEALASIPKDQHNYHSLYELGLSDLAEELSRFEHEAMDTPVWWGVRAMYEGSMDGVHTLCLHASGNVCEYHGAFGRGSEQKGMWELKFSTAVELRRQLEQLRTAIESAF